MIRDTWPLSQGVPDPVDFGGKGEGASLEISCRRFWVIAKDSDRFVEGVPLLKSAHRTRKAMGTPSKSPRSRPPISPIETHFAFILVTEPTKPA